MASNSQEFKTAIFEDGTCAVLRADPSKPQLMEVIATFHDAARARDYVRFENIPSYKHQEERPVIKQAPVAKPRQASKATLVQPSAAKIRVPAEAKPKPVSEDAPKNMDAEVSERQTAVLKALRSLMDKKNLVEVTKAELAKAASIPSGSLRSVLVSLEKKGMVRTERQGTPKSRAIYQVLENSQKKARSLNGAVQSKEAQAKTIAL